MRPKNKRAERPHDEPDRERREIRDDRERVVALGIEERRNDRGQTSENVEVVPLDHRADGRRGDDLPDLVIAALYSHYYFCAIPTRFGSASEVAGIVFFSFIDDSGMRELTKLSAWSRERTICIKITGPAGFNSISKSELCVPRVPLLKGEGAPSRKARPGEGYRTAFSVPLTRPSGHPLHSGEGFVRGFLRFGCPRGGSGAANLQDCLLKAATLPALAWPGYPPRLQRAYTPHKPAGKENPW